MARHGDVGFAVFLLGLGGAIVGLFCVCLFVLGLVLTVLLVGNRYVYFEPFYFGNNLWLVLSMST